MPRTPKYIVLIIAYLILLGCGYDVEDSTSPDPPQWVPKSLPEEWPEQGIDAYEGGGVVVEWYANDKDQNVKEYKLYRSRHSDFSGSSNQFEMIASQLDIGSDVYQIIDQNIEFGEIYEYKLRCVDISDYSSEFSNSIMYLPYIPTNPATMTPNGHNQTLASDRSLQWKYSYNTPMEDYTLTILDEFDQFIFRRQFLPGNYTGEIEEFVIPDSVYFVMGRTYKWRVDLSGSYQDGRERAGSESPWAIFLYSG